MLNLFIALCFLFCLIAIAIDYRERKKGQRSFQSFAVKVRDWERLAVKDPDVWDALYGNNAPNPKGIKRP